MDFFPKRKQLALFFGRVLLFYFALMAMLTLLQNKLLYYPDTMSLDQTEQMAKNLSLQIWPGNRQYQGLLAEPNVTAATPYRGTVVVFHGNAGSALDRTYYSDALKMRGFRTILAEFPGYGPRHGKLGEDSFVPDASQTLQLAYRQFGRPLYVMGESLGAGVASAAVANAGVPIDGVALITPWDSLPDLAQSKYWYMPARWLIHDRFDNIANLNKWGGRTAICIASVDKIIPPAHGERLFMQLTTPKQRWIFEGRGHNNWPIEAQHSWWSEVMTYLESGQRSKHSKPTAMIVPL